ncbi:MAG: hypothetical protein ACE5OZ_07370 [Candidatus Heimdallarchaeota archaeon]
MSRDEVALLLLSPVGVVVAAREPPDRLVARHEEERAAELDQAAIELQVVQQHALEDPCREMVCEHGPLQWPQFEVIDGQRVLRCCRKTPRQSTE